MSESSATIDIVVSLPQNFLSEIDGFIKQEKIDRNELIYNATRTYIREKKKSAIREAMRRGYMEMAKINLSISLEAVHAEYEAEHTVEKLVSGG